MSQRSIKYQVSSIKYLIQKNTRYIIHNTKYRKSAGFTLIEFLVVIGVLAIAVGSSLVFLTSSLRGSNQAHISAQVKQNGQAVLDGLENQIRNARDVVALGPAPAPLQVPNSASSAIRLTLVDGSNLFIVCADGNATSNGWIGSSIVYAASVTSPEFTPLTNKDAETGVNISPCKLSVIDSSESSKPPVVSVSFKVSQGVGAPSRQDFVATEHFQTTISLRNYEF